MKESSLLGIRVDGRIPTWVLPGRDQDPSFFTKGSHLFVGQPETKAREGDPFTVLSLQYKVGVPDPVWPAERRPGQFLPLIPGLWS